MVSCQKGPTRHAYAWQIWPLWQDTLELFPKAAFADWSRSKCHIKTCQHMALNSLCAGIIIRKTWYIQMMWARLYAPLCFVLVRLLFRIASLAPEQCNHCSSANEVILKHDDVIKWKSFPRYLPFVRGIHRSPVNSPHKGQWRGALMFSLICAWINTWVNNREAGDLRRHRAHYDIIVMRMWVNESRGFTTNS